MGLITEFGERQSPITHELMFRPYKVSQVGQMTLPAELRRSFGVTDGGFIEVCYFDQGLLIVPLGKSKDLIEQTFPYVQPDTRLSPQEKVVELGAWFQGDRSKRFSWTSVIDEVEPTDDSSIKRTEAMSDAFKPYKISSVGQFTIVADARRDWGLRTHPKSPKTFSTIMQ